jgi:hypothetical protein
MVTIQPEVTLHKDLLSESWTGDWEVSSSRGVFSLLAGALDAPKTAHECRLCRINGRTMFPKAIRVGRGGKQIAALAIGACSVLLPRRRRPSTLESDVDGYRK